MAVLLHVIWTITVSSPPPASLSVDERRLRSGTVEDLLSSMARGGKPTPVLKQLSTLQTFVQQREMDKVEVALKELHSTPSLSEGESL